MAFTIKIVPQWTIPAFMALSFFALVLTGCSTAGPHEAAETLPLKTRQAQLNQLKNWQLNGKIAVQTAQDSGSASVDWIQHPQQFTLSFFGPLGTHGFKLTGRPGLVTLDTSDGKHYSANTPEQLLAKEWGWHLPVSHLQYWVRGLSVPGIPYQSQLDANERFSELTQDGWHIQFLSYTHTQGLPLPSKIFISSKLMKVKMVIYSWKIRQPSNGSLA